MFNAIQPPLEICSILDTPGTCWQQRDVAILLFTTFMRSNEGILSFTQHQRWSCHLLSLLWQIRTAIWSWRCFRHFTCNQRSTSILGDPFCIFVYLLAIHSQAGSVEHVGVSENQSVRKNMEKTTVSWEVLTFLVGTPYWTGAHKPVKHIHWWMKVPLQKVSLPQALDACQSSHPSK